MNARDLAWRRLRVVLAVAGLGLVGTFVQAAGQGMNVMEQPARQSTRINTAVLTSVAQAGSRLVAVGERGYVLLSDDNGKSWRQAKNVPTSVTLTALHFGSAKTGWAVGHSGVILKTVDGGETWSRQLDGKQAAAIEKKAADAAAASGSDGTSRRQQSAIALVADGADKPFLDVFFFDDQRGLVVGAYGLAFGTSDGGKTWSSLIGQIDNDGARHLYSIAAKGDVVVLTGEQGLVLRSNDGGKQFAAIAPGYAGTMFGAVMPGESLVVFGLRGNVFRSRDNGQKWEKLAFDQPVTLSAGLTLKDGRTVVADETGRVLVSSDGGAHFVQLNIPKMNAATDLVEASDGALVATTLRGPVRIEPTALRLESKQ